MRTRISPPTNSAFDLYFIQNTLPTFTPIADRINVVHPMKVTAQTMFTCKNANVTPTASASILVATARANIVFTSKLAFSSSSSSSLDYLIILIPMIPRRTNAIQWSICVIMDSNWLPRR